MIVWGGGYGSGGLNTGGRYDPSTDSWVATSTGANVPSARAGHSAVWTGSEMIVWGGTDGTMSNTGGRYNPSTDSWQATSTGANVPSARRFHTAVWTGSEMIVWGGWPTTNTGGRYSPPSDHWVATSTGANVPSARAYHTAVWTGSEMIVWAGFDDYVDVNTGGRYSPSTNSWQPTSTGANVPSARESQTAVWTGNEMIVWGGGDYIGATNTGGRYDPSTDSWLTTSTGANLPSARYSPTAVWTGREMIVWGGSTYTRWNTGGIYCSCGGGSVATWYPDADADGLGAGSAGLPSCAQPPGYVAVGGDCDDRYPSCTTVCIDADSDGLPVCAGDCNDTIHNCTTDCRSDGDADGVPDCAEEEVVTIYFGGTKMKSWMWDPDQNDAFSRPETVATLHHFQNTGRSPRGENHTKHFVEGFDEDLNPPWEAHNTEALVHLNETHECEAQCITLNLVGFSRGGVSALRFARHVTMTSPWSRLQSLKKINVLAFDPVPGDETGADNNADWFNLSPGVEYLGFYAEDERAFHFSPVFPARPPSNPSNPRINFFKVRGAHETPVGNTQVNGHDGDDGYDNAGLTPVSHTLIMAATEFLGSSDWGHVRFRTPSYEESFHGALQLNWYQGETDVDQLRQYFANELGRIYEYSDSGYQDMREHSSVVAGLLESWFGSGWACFTSVASEARNNPRCVYDATGRVSLGLDPRAELVHRLCISSSAVGHEDRRQLRDLEPDPGAR